MPSTRDSSGARRALRIAIGLALLACALLAAYAVIAAPPRAAAVPAHDWRPRVGGSVVRGAYHVHTTRSDGTGSLDDVAAAASRAGLDFVVFTDHGDGTRRPEPPSYRAGVLCIDGVEISTTGGHYAALGLPQAPYPLAGDPAAVVEDVARLGGFGIATHPDSPKPALRWRDWSLPIDAFEWLNADSEWRAEPRPVLARAALYYALRGPEAIAALFERPVATLARWDEAGQAGRRWIALAGADAHARIGPRGAPDDDERGLPDEAWSLPLPSYASVFRSLSLHVELDRRLGENAPADAILLVDAIRRGRVFTVIDGYATPGAFEFLGERASGTVRMGDVIPPGDLPVRLRARVVAPPGATLVLLRNGVAVSSGTGLEVVHDVLQGEAVPAMFRVEVRLAEGGSRVAAPWIVSNAIYVAGSEAVPGAHVSPPTPGAGEVEELAMQPGAWRTEHDPQSTARLREASRGQVGALAFEFALGSAPRNAWSAIAHTLERRPGSGGVITLSARASQPLRVSVQLRVETPDADLRWRRSVFLDASPRTLEIPVATMTPVTRAVPADRLRDARGVLLVVDRVNTAPGTTGTIWVDAVRVRSER